MYVIQLHSWRILKHMRSILLTDGEFTGMIRALRALPFPVRIVGFVSSDRAAHTAMLDASYVPPSGNGDAYFDFLTEIIRKEGIDTVFPIVTLDLEYIAEKAAEIEKLTGARVITPSPEAVRVLNNKYTLYEALKEDGILGPSVPGYARASTFGELRSAVRDFSGRSIPCVIKPVRGENAEGFLRLIDRREYEERVLSGNPEHLASLDIFDSHDDGERLPGERLVMPYLPGREYDVDTVSEDGKLLAVTMRENAEMYGGLSACTKTCFNEKLLLYAKRLAEVFRLSGLACISFREDENGDIKLLEVNPRAMGSISMSAICGNNLLEYILCEKKEAPKDTVITRAGVTASLYNDLITVIDEEREEWRRFEEIDRERYEWFHGKVRTRMTDLTYSCRLAWNRKYDIRWTVMEDCLVMISDADAYMLMPLGDYDVKKLRRITDRVRSYFISRGLPFQILCIDESMLSLFEKLGYSGAELSFSEDYSDYLYNADGQIAVVPAKIIRQIRAHDTQPQHGADAPEAMQPVHVAGFIMQRNVIIQRCIHAACAETIRNRPTAELPIRPRSGKSQQCHRRQADTECRYRVGVEAADHTVTHQAGGSHPQRNDYADDTPHDALRQFLYRADLHRAYHQ